MGLPISKGALAIAAVAALLAATPATARSQGAPVITGYGAISSTAGAAERPDPRLRYRVVFDISKAAPNPAAINPSLEKVARFLNLLGADGVRPQPGDVVAIVHGPATPIVANDAAYASRTKAAANPNLALIGTLQAAGVTIALCSQAMHGSGLDAGDLAAKVRVDVSALTTLATLQLQGWALIPD